MEFTLTPKDVVSYRKDQPNHKYRDRTEYCL